MSKNNSLEIITLNKPGITDFAKERNELLRKSKSEWVLFLDSDETFTPALSQEINQLINNSVKSVNGYYVYRKNYFLGKYIGTDNIIRLARRNAGKWKRKVHEVWRIKGKIGQMRGPLIHNSAKNLHEFIGKINFYSTIHAEENRESGKKSNLFKIVFYPPAKFFQSLLMGRGFVFSMLQSLHSFLAWSKEWKLQRN